MRWSLEKPPHYRHDGPCQVEKFVCVRAPRSRLATVPGPAAATTTAGCAAASAVPWPPSAAVAAGDRRAPAPARRNRAVAPLTVEVRQQSRRRQEHARPCTQPRKTDRVEVFQQRDQVLAAGLERVAQPRDVELAARRLAIVAHG